MRPSTIETQNIDLAATIQAVTGTEPTITQGGPLATFTFPAAQIVKDVLVGYETGLQIEARRLLATRNQLFRRLRGGRA